MPSEKKPLKIETNASFVNSTCDALRDLVPFVQFKKREKHSSLGVFRVFKIVQMVPNRSTHPTCSQFNF